MNFSNLKATINLFCFLQISYFDTDFKIYASTAWLAIFRCKRGGGAV
jgi:hypothetical protein